MSDSRAKKRSHIEIDATMTSSTGGSQQITLRVDHTTTITTSGRGETLPDDDDDDLLSLRVVRKGKTRPPRPREYQNIAIRRVVASLKGGMTRVGLSAATGSEKTTMFVEMIDCIPLREEGDKVLILVPSIEIQEQVLEEVRDRLVPRDYDVSVEQGSRLADMSADM